MIDRRGVIGLTGSAAIALLLFARPGTASTGLRFSINHTPDEWRRLLGAQRYAILREAATERAFTSPLLNEHRNGVFTCAGCALPLFSSASKVRKRNGLAELLEVAAARGGHSRRSQLDDGTHRSALAPVAAAILGTCSTMAQSRRGCATA